MILYSILSTPDVASVALSVNVRVFVQSVGSAVVSTGSVESIFSVAAFQALVLPALSVARV